MKKPYKIIDSGSEVKNFAKVLEKEKTVAVDLEADSMYHFQERVCLLQFATENESAVIDPIKIEDISSLAPFFADPEIKKIFHGADYDVRSLYRDFGFEVNNLFDTQVACMFLGLKGTGLDTVLNQRFNITLNKKYQKKDWSVRPLSEKMIEYAATDVIYLLPLAEMLEKELQNKGRLYWVKEESEIISKARPAFCDDQPLFLKFKGAGRLGNRKLAILEALLQFRMRMAGKKDKPLFKIFGNETVMKIVHQKPLNLKELKRAKAFSPKQIGMYGLQVVKLVTETLEVPEEDLPVYPRKKAPVVEAAVPRRVKILKDWRTTTAKELKMSSGLILSNALISLIAVKNPRSTAALGRIGEMKNWQKKEFGKEIVDLLKSAG